jgi:general secretion pathway protein K
MPLLYALWAVTLLTIIATATLGSGTVSYRQTRNLAEAAQQDALAEAAVNRAVLALMATRPEQRWRVDGVAQSFGFAGATVVVAVQDELGRVDINNADTPLVTAALRAGGLSAQAASETADKILDWRDAGSAKRLHGAKAPDYAAAGLAYGPRNGPFQSVDELRLVLGITPQLFRRIEPLVTVHSGRAMIDPQFAPEKLVAAISGSNTSAPGALSASPDSRGNRRGVIGPSISLEGRAFSIQVMLGKADSIREAAIRMTSNPTKPYWLLSWRMARSR